MIIEGKRALCYTARVDAVTDIPGYDRVMQAHVGGWNVIVSKNDGIKADDVVIYFEIDSKLPSSDSRFDFLASRHYKIKTIRMCKTISQGLIMPLHLFPEIDDNVREGIDVTDLLGVTYSVQEDNVRKASPDKYQGMKARHKKLFKNKFVKHLMKYEWFRKLMFMFFGKKKDNAKAFPTGFPYVHKTDEERVENMPWILNDKSPLIVTEKLDGTSCTYILERKKHGKFEFYVSSRNVRQLRPDQKCYHDSNIYWELALKYDIERHLKQYLLDNPELDYVCIQGEGVGSVQGNPLKLKDNNLFVFNFIRSDIGRLPSTAGEVIVHEWGMMWVPILDTNYILPDDMEEFKQFATAKSVVNPAVLREGIVLRNPETDLSFKNVSREYLCKHGG